jgi:membrane associated rhomboid family serine protease
VFVPLVDDNPLQRIRFQFVTIALIVINVGMYLLQLAAIESPEVLGSFAVVPGELFAAGAGYVPHHNDAVPVPERLTLLTYMFLHGDWLHLIGNMLFLWVFGDNVEDAMGHVRFLVFYIACGVFAGLTHAFMMPDSPDALIGASGAVSGVVSAYLILHPRVRVWVLALKFIPLRISAALALSLWIAFQILMLFVPQVPGAATAWWAHIGGLLAGAVLIPFMKDRRVPLFGRPQ